MRTRSLHRRASLTTISVEPFSGVDGQGAPAYSTASEIDARPVKATEFRSRPDGSTITVSLIVYVPGDASPRPAYRDRLTVTGSKYIVENVAEATALNGTVDHVRVEARDE